MERMIGYAKDHEITDGLLHQGRLHNLEQRKQDAISSGIQQNQVNFLRERGPAGSFIEESPHYASAATVGEFCIFVLMLMYCVKQLRRYCFEKPQEDRPG